MMASGVASSYSRFSTFSRVITICLVRGRRCLVSARVLKDLQAMPRMRALARMAPRSMEKTPVRKFRASRKAEVREAWAREAYRWAT